MPSTYNLDIDSTIGYPISKGYVRSKLAPMKGRPVAVRINSYGGDVQTALDIRQQFVDHGNVTAYIFGMTASAATILAMGAKRVVMSRYALMLVHQCSGWVDTWGMMNKDELEQAIASLLKAQADLGTIDRVVASLYAQRTGKPVKDMASLMAEARWLSADECLKSGLIDEILEDKDDAPQQLTAQMREHFMACGLPVPESTSGGDRATTCGVGATTACPAQPEVASDAHEAASILGRIRALFAKSDNPTNKPQPMPNTIITYAAIMAALPCEGLEADAEGRVTLTAEQLKAIDDRLATLTRSSDERAARVTKLEAEIKDLKAADGAVTSEVDPAAATSDTLPGAEAAEFFKQFSDII